MARYFFDVINSSPFMDEEGSEFSDLDAVRTAAVTLAGEVIQDHAERFWGGEAWKFSVRDDAGNPVFTFSFSATTPELLN